MDDKKELYLEWLLTPPAERSPRTKREFAEYIGVAHKTLYNWERSDWFINQIRKVKGTLSVRWYGDIVNRMKDVVDSGNDRDAINAAKLLLQHLEVPDVKTDDGVDEEKLAKALEEMGFTIVKSNGQ